MAKEERRFGKTRRRKKKRRRRRNDSNDDNGDNDIKLNNKHARVRADGGKGKRKVRGVRAK